MKQPTQRSVLGKMATYLQLALLLFTSHFASGDASYRSEKAPSSSLFVAGEGMSCSYINASGQRAFLATFDDCLDFSDGYAPVQINKKWGFINGVGNWKSGPGSMNVAGSFSEGLGLVILDKKYGFINSSGQFVVHPKYDLSFPFRNGLAAVPYGKWQPGEGSDFAGPSYDGNWGYIDKVGNEVREFS